MQKANKHQKDKKLIIKNKMFKNKNYKICKNKIRIVNNHKIKTNMIKMKYYNKNQSNTHSGRTLTINKEFPYQNTNL